MKNVHLLSNGYYFSKMQQGKRVWVNLNTTDESLAITRALKIRQNPFVQLALKHNIKDEVEEFISYKQRQGHFTRSSAMTKLHTLKQFIAWLPESASMSNITNKQVSDFYEHLRTDKKKHGGLRTESTVRGYMISLRSLFQWAIKIQKARADNPVMYMDFGRVEKVTREKWCLPEQRDELIKNTPNDNLKFILIMGFYFGLRRNEIVEARKDWFDFRHGLLHVLKAINPPRLREGELAFRIKKREERTVPMHPFAKKFLVKYIGNQKINDLDFVLHPENGYGQWRYRYDFRRPFTDYMQSDFWKKKNKDYSWVTPHVMRHTFASILSSMGVAIHKVAKWLGDTVKTTEDHYAHLLPKDKDIEAL